MDAYLNSLNTRTRRQPTAASRVLLQGVLLALGPVSAAHAGVDGPAVPAINPTLIVGSGNANSTDLLGVNSSPDENNDFTYHQGVTTLGNWGNVSFDLTVNPDPFIDGTITITNLSNSARNFTVALSLPVTPVSGGSLYGGSINATVFDTGSGSATLKYLGSDLNPVPIYEGIIDGSPVLTLFAQSLQCTSVGCSANGSESDGLPDPTLIGPAVSGQIGTVLQFNLSARDRVVFNTHFEVAAPVPVPAAVWLMASGLIGLAGVARRRNA